MGAGARPVVLAPDALGGQITAALRGTAPAGPAGPVQLFTVTDRSGLPLVCAADGRVRPPAWTGIVLLDDAPGVHAREEAHKRRWRAWLYWSNLLQFLDTGGGDAVQLTTSRLDGFPVETLAVTGGSGVLQSVRLTLAPAETAPQAPPAVVEVSAPPLRDTAWDKVIEYLDPDERGLLALAETLAARGVPVPRDGYELDANTGWQAELAWPDARVGVVRTPNPPEGEDFDPEAADRDRDFAAAGWEVRTAADWTADALADRLGHHQSDDTTTDNGGNDKP
ncbi:hypothetical protein ACH5AO_36195 [Streptomyces sp. NPDC018964]|uniref:hypothetical protein n=1 Tax=Streptomyces sp. NPDC018964 TaxID=3365058 RepID=UPI003796546A